MIEILGKGKEVFASGDMFEGEYENDKGKHGKFTWSNGDSFEGPSSEKSYSHGIGLYTVNGVSRKAEFKDGAFFKYLE